MAIIASRCCLRRGAFESKDGPVRLPAGEIGSKVAGNPELGAIQRNGAIPAIIHLQGDVEAAVVPGSVTVMASMGGRLGVEKALAEHRTGARLDRGSIERPLGQVSTSPASDTPRTPAIRTAIDIGFIANPPLGSHALTQDLITAAVVQATERDCRALSRFVTVPNTFQS